MTKPDMKSELKRQILGVRTYEYNGEAREREYSSEDEKKHGYSVLIDQTYRIAGEMGVLLPNPDFRKHKNDEYI